MSMKITDHFYAEAITNYGDIMPFSARQHWAGDECWCNPEVFDIEVILRKDYAERLRLPDAIKFFLHRTDSDFYNEERKLTRDLVTLKIEKKDAWFLKGLV